MPRSSDKRERLIDAADRLIHRNGFHRTTLADIAKESGVPLGNVYYYFKTKEDICEAVIQERKKELNSVLDCCCESRSPGKSLLSLLKSMIDASEEIADQGCPHGRLCTELSNEVTGLTSAADDCLRVLLDWSREQFQAMGYSNAAELGFEFVARIQGIILVGNSLHDGKQVRRQLESVAGWIRSMEDRSHDGKYAA